jgi:uncharacterized protein involved in outer membrane biogenesis
MKVAWGPRMRKVALWVGVALALYAVAGFLIAPPIVRHQLEKRLGELLGRKVTVESVRINPFALTASLRNFAVKEANGGADGAGFEELSVNVTLSSLLRRGVVVEAVTLSKPYMRAVRFEDGRYSFQDIVDKFANAPPAPPKPSPRFAVYNIRVSGGRVDFDDRPVKTQHAVSDIEVGLPFVSSLPKEVDIVVQPRLSAKLNGAPFEIAGETKPFKDTREATLRIDLDELELAKYLEYSPMPLRIRVPSGRLTSRLVLSSTAGQDNTLQTLTLSGTASLQALTVQEAGGGPLAALGRLSVDLESLDLLKRSAAIKAVRIEAPELDIVRQIDGSLNLQAALPAAPAQPVAESPEQPEQPFALTIADVALLGGQVRFVDGTPPQPVRLEVDDVSMQVQGLSSAPESRADLRLTARVNRAAPVEIAGKVNLLSPQLFADLIATERGIDLLPMSPYSVMYAGHAIEKGTLSLKHVIKLETRTLGTQNSIRLDQFTLGEKVESPTATKLPVGLAVSMLKGPDGIINVDLPVSVPLDDPNAARVDTVTRKIGAFIGHTATQPFAMLGSLVGGGAELAYLEFAPGSAVLGAAGEERLGKLARALHERPELALNVSGRADPEADGTELKRAAATNAGAEPPTEVSISENDLRELAQARAQAARDWLVGTGKLATDRVAIAAPRMNAEGITDKGQPTRVDFALR